MATNGSWQDLYKAAMLELNSAKLRSQIQLARAAMQQRSEELVQDCGASSLAEQRMMADALWSLGMLERSELKSDFEARNQSSDNTVMRHGTA
ncbi:MAG: hypothetical protein JWO91_3081 [Acidobacteriaceae bacterium]|nr:hypothetical protein [Acidobacteriaceae bacterium]